jgi:hypothetical protein
MQDRGLVGSGLPLHIKTDAAIPPALQRAAVELMRIAGPVDRSPGLRHETRVLYNPMACGNGMRRLLIGCMI